MNRPCRYLLLITAALAIGVKADAQTKTKEVKEGISNEQQLIEHFGTAQLLELPVNSINRAVLTQDGNRNIANLDQRVFGGQGNTIAVLQLGNANEVNANQTGAGNSTSVKQIGNHNTTDTDINGYNTESTIIQDGNNNQVTQDLNVNYRRYKVEQQGNNNELNQRESGAAAPPGYEIRMRGSGIHMTIEQGKVLP